MSLVIRLKVPIEMHYAVIPMGTSKVNSSPLCLTSAIQFTDVLFLYLVMFHISLL